MKTLDIALLGVSVVIAAGLVSFSGVFTDENVDAYEIPNIYSGGMGILGHAEFIVHDSDGNIKAYSQSDNAIINAGRDCAARFLFHNDTASATINCKDGDLTTGFDGFRYVALSNSSGINGLLDSDATLGSDFVLQMTGALTATAQTPVFTAASGAGGTTLVSISKASVSIDDTIGSTNVTQSALLDAVAGNAAAIINIPNGVSIDDGDTLTVTWTINVG